MTSVVGFRRGVVLFLAILIGFLTILLATLWILLDQSVSTAEQQAERRRGEIARIAAESLGAADPSSISELEGMMVALRVQYSIAGIELTTPQGAVLSSGTGALPGELAAIERTGRFGTVRLLFDGGELAALRSRVDRARWIVLAGSVSGIIFLLLFIPRLLRPIEEMLREAEHLGPRPEDSDEAEFLIDTFRRTVETLRVQEKELRQLHQLERERADDLQRITTTLTRSISSGLVVLAPDASILDLNGAAREILGITAPSPSGSRPQDVIPDRGFARRITDAVESSLVLTREEIELSEPEGRIVGLSTVPLMGEAGTPIGVLALFTDLTEIRQLERHVRQTQALADLGEISAGIAHEFRNSLAAILGYLKLARQGGLPPVSERRIVHAETEASELAAAVDALLQFARPMDLHREPVRLDLLAAEVIERLEGQIDGASVERNLERATIDGDPALLRRAVENIIRNAMESVRLKGSGRVRVDVAEAGRALLTVEDEGLGLDPALAGRYFLPFQSGKPGGMGLGLPLARKVILLHEGEITLTGEPGRGAVVSVTLPSAHGEREEREAQQHA
jgi:signal transduction histidine kinase